MLKEDFKIYHGKTYMISNDISLEQAKEYQKERQARKAKEVETTKALMIKYLLDGKSKEEIASDLKVKWSLVNRVEAELKEQQQRGILINSYLQERKKLLPKVLECGLNLLANGLKHRLDEGTPLDLREAKIVSEIISNIDHIARLDAGDPTSIVDVNKTIPSTLKDMVAALKKDPFIDTQLLVKEIEFVDVTQEKEDGSTEEV